MGYKAVTQIAIHNFQSHRDTVIVPSRGINVIVGKNLSGKSAILRALRLLFFNKPDGSDFVSWGASDTEIEVEYDGCVIRRVKGKRVNSYTVDGSIFSGFGKAIPQEVIDILGIVPVRVDDELYELPIADPHAPPFLISETDALKGKILSQLATHLLGDLVLFDRAITTANTRLRRFSAEAEIVRGELVSVEQGIHKYSSLLDVGKLLESCHEILLGVRDGEDSLFALRRFSSDFKMIGERFDAVSCLNRVYDLVIVNTVGREALALYERQCSFVEKQALLREIDSEIRYLCERYSCLDAIPDVLELRKILDVLSRMRVIKERLFRVLDQVQSLRERDLAIDEELSVAVVEYKDVLLQIGRCPICFGTIDAHDTDRIIQEVSRGRTEAPGSFNYT